MKTITQITIIILLSCFVLNNNSYAESDCREIWRDYENKIDTGIRPVYLEVDSMPEILSGNNLPHFLIDNFKMIDNGPCFPLYIYYGFVVEKDCSISNIVICPQLEFCDGNDNDIKTIEEKYICLLTEQILNIKTNSGILNGENVAIYTKGRIHIDPQ